MVPPLYMVTAVIRRRFLYFLPYHATFINDDCGHKLQVLFKLLHYLHHLKGWLPVKYWQTLWLLSFYCIKSSMITLRFDSYLHIALPYTVYPSPITLLYIRTSIVLSVHRKIVQFLRIAQLISSLVTSVWGSPCPTQEFSHSPKEPHHGVLAILEVGSYPSHSQHTNYRLAALHSSSGTYTIAEALAIHHGGSP